MREVLATGVAAIAVTGLIASSQARATATDDAKNRKIMYSYARCVVHASHKQASAMIIADENNAAIVAHYSELIDPDCMGRTGGNVSMSFGGDLFRYALADALVNADYAGNGPQDFTDRLPLAHLVAPNQNALNAALAKTRSAHARAELQKGFDTDVVNAWLSRYGECIVRQDPVDARLWVLTPPDSPEEMSRINMLRPVFASCLDNRAGTLKFNRIIIRGTVAINYYRLAMATPVASLQKAH